MVYEGAKNLLRDFPLPYRGLAICPLTRFGFLLDLAICLAFSGGYHGSTRIEFGD